MDDKQIKKDRATSYQQMFELWAWKDYQSYLNALRESTVNDFINFDAKEAVEFRAGQYKGFLDCLTKIKTNLEHIVNEN